VLGNRGFFVFFGADSAELTERGRQVLRELANWWKSHHGRMIGINGAVDTAEAASGDNGLGERRAIEVGHFLVEQGVPSNHVYIKNVGASRLLVPTGPNVHEPQNRFVFFDIAVTMSDHQLADLRECYGWLKSTYCDRSPDERTAKACEQALQMIMPPDEDDMR